MIRQRLSQLNYPVTTISIVICVIVYVMQMFHPEMVSKYGLFAVPLAQQGYYRVFTYTFLHGGMYHIVANMGSLYNLGMYVETIQGTKKYLISFVVSAVTSALAIVHNMPWTPHP